jgi:hypothetical protein
LLYGRFRLRIIDIKASIKVKSQDIKIALGYHLKSDVRAFLSLLIVRLTNFIEKAAIVFNFY